MKTAGKLCVLIPLLLTIMIAADNDQVERNANNNKLLYFLIRRAKCRVDDVIHTTEVIGYIAMVSVARAHRTDIAEIVYSAPDSATVRITLCRLVSSSLNRRGSLKTDVL